MNSSGISAVKRLFQIQLFRHLSYHASQEIDFDYMLWGYFDWMNIKEVENFTSLYKNNGDLQARIIQNYDVHKLCIYSLENDSLAQEINDPSLPPLLTLSEIKGKYWSDNKEDAFKKIENDLQTAIKGNKKVKSRLFRSLGYSDFVIFLWSTNYQDSIDIIDNLRTDAYIHSTYSISGVKHQSELLPGNKGDLSLRVSVKSPEALSSTLITGFSAIPKDKRNEIEWDLFPVFGKYDYEVSFKNIDLKYFVDIYKRTFSPHAQFHSQNISYSNTRWLLKDGRSTKDFILKNIRDDEENPGDESDDGNGTNKELLKKAELVQKWEHNPESIKNELQKLMQLYFQVICNEASDPLLHDEIKTVTEVFFDLINQSQNGFSKEEPPDPKAITDYYKNVKKGIQTITQLYESRIQAFRFYTELPYHKYQCMENATKILLTYMKIVGGFNGIIQKINNSSPQQKPPKLPDLFFVTTYSDQQIESFTLFPDQNRRLIPIHINENDFFDIPYTIQIIIHEMSHFLCMADINKALFPSICDGLARKYFFELIFGQEIMDDQHEMLMKCFPISELTASLSKFLKDTIESAIGVIPDTYYNKPVEVYSAELLNAIREAFSLITSDFVTRGKELNSALNRISAKNRISLSSFKDIADCLVGRLQNYEDTTYLQRLWEIEVANIDKLLDKDELRKCWSILLDCIKDREKELKKNIKQHISNEWFSKIDVKILASGVKPHAVKYFLDHLAKTRLFENTALNNQFLAEHLLRFLNQSVASDWIKKGILRISMIYKEAFADYFMCSFLALSRDQYASLQKDFRDKMTNVFEENNMKDLEIRKLILDRAGVFPKNPSESTNNIDCGMNIDEIVQKIKDLKEKGFLPEPEDLFFRELREYIKSFYSSTEDQRSDIMLTFVETQWRKTESANSGGANVSN